MDSLPQEEAGRWRRIEKIYGAVLTLPPAERSLYLDRHCADDPVLRQEIDSLLRADAEASGYFSGTGAQARLSAALEGAPAVPEIVGHYEILSQIGAGGMGDVYLARDPVLDRRVALKVLPAALTDDSSFRQRLVQEARAASALNHPNILTVHEIGEADGIHYIVTEFIEGLTLRQRLAEGSLRVEEALGIALQCAAAFEAGHQAGIAHRDIKPENVMLRPDGLVKVLDFGLAYRGEEPQNSLETGVSAGSALMGTPRYMSPEQARGLGLDARSDVFSLGAVIYELVTGRPRFLGSSIADVLAAVISTDPGQLSGGWEGVPPELRAVLEKALAKDREQRYAGMREFRAELTGVRERLTAPVSPPTVRRGRRWLMVAAVAACVLIPVAVWLAGRGGVASLQPLVPAPLTSDPGFEFAPRLSPDGKRIAYTQSAPNGSPMVFVQAVEPASSAPVQIAQRAHSPAWSPDGKALAFLQNEKNAHSTNLVVFEFPGGTQRKVAEVRTPGPFQAWIPNPYLDFSPDGRYLVAPDQWGPNSQPGLFLISLSTGEKRRLTSPDPNLPGDYSPRFSPDGRRLAFGRLRRFACTELYVLDLTADMRPAGPPVHVDTGELWNASPAWSPDGQSILFSSGAMESPELKMARLGRVPRVHSLPVTERGVLTVDVQGRTKAGAARIVYTLFSENTDIYRIDLAAQAQDAGSRKLVPLVNSSFLDEMPLYSPDGKSIAFISNRTGLMQVWIARADGSEARQVSRFRSAQIHNPVWAPDGRHMAMDLTRPGEEGIYQLDVEGGALKQLVAGTADAAVYSPDGRWLYYRVPQQKPTSWRIPAEGGPAEQMPQLPGEFLRFTPDGQAVVFSRGLSVYLQPLAGGPLSKLFGAIYSEQSFAVGRSGVYAVNKEAAMDPWGAGVWRYSDRRYAPLAIYDRAANEGIAISPDERNLLVTQREHLIMDVKLLDRVDLSRY